MMKTAGVCIHTHVAIHYQVHAAVELDLLEPSKQDTYSEVPPRWHLNQDPILSVHCTIHSTDCFALQFVWFTPNSGFL